MSNIDLHVSPPPPRQARVLKPRWRSKFIVISGMQHENDSRRPVKGVSGLSHEVDLFIVTVVAKKMDPYVNLRDVRIYTLAVKIMIQKLDSDALLSVLASLHLISAHLS